MNTIPYNKENLRMVISDHPHCYLRLTVEQPIKEYKRVYKVHTTIDGVRQVIALGSNPIVYTNIENLAMLSLEEITNLPIGQEIIIPITLLKEWDGRVLYRTVSDKYIYKIGDDLWKKIIINFKKST